MIEEEIYTVEERELLSHCTLCPRECGIDRFEGRNGWCGADAGMNIASICIHRGEEPPISGPEGICNIFFSGCNLGCVFCQNHEISFRHRKSMDLSITLKETIDTVEKILSRGIKAVGFVSPSHVVPQVKAIIRGLRSRNLNPVTVYNTNSYDSEDTIESLDGEIDVYLPDFKYNTPVIAQEFSGAADYPRVALKALKTMYRQRGSTLQLDSEGRARSGMLIRHLVIPNHAGESERSLSAVAGELSNDIHVSLMSQYYPNPLVRGHPVLGRTLLKEEYESVVETMERLGFRNGWIQELDSHLNYRPDFRKDQPFD